MAMSVINNGRFGICFLFVGWAMIMASVYFCYPTSYSPEQQEEETRKEMINSVRVSPWPNDKDAFVVVDVMSVSDTGIKNIVVKRQQDNRYFSALSGRDDIRKGSIVKLAFLRKVDNDNGMRSSVSIVAATIKE